VTRSPRWAAAAGLAAAVSLWRDRAAWGFAASGAFDGRSLRYLASYALWPTLLAAAALALCWLAGRGLWRLAEAPALDGGIE